MKVLTGKYEIYTSGCVNSAGMNPIIFSLLNDQKFDIVVEVIFDEEDQSIDYAVTKEGELTFSFKNPNLMDWGLTSPIKIGHLDGRELLVVFRVTVHGNKSSYTLNYTFYLGEETND